MDKPTIPYHNTGGRDRRGKVVLRTRGSRVYKRLRIVDGNKRNFGVPGTTTRIEYDPNRSSFTASIVYDNDICTYITHTLGSKIGSRVVPHVDIQLSREMGIAGTIVSGHSSHPFGIPLGTVIHDPEKYPGSGGSIARSAGTLRILLRRFNRLRKCLVKIPSGESIPYSVHCMCTKGMVGNKIMKRISLGKAGRNRLSGRKPIVRGVAKNPVDHPHGGGEGKKSKKCFPRTAWGKMLHRRSTGIRIVRVLARFRNRKVNRDESSY